MSGKAYYYDDVDVEASPSSQNNYSTAFSMPPAKTQREIELDQREMELKLREERLARQEQQVGEYHPPNFPPCKPLVYHDIDKDIPQDGRWLVKRLFFAWYHSVAVATYVLNFIAAIGLLSTKAEASGSTFGVALIIMLIGVPVAFAFWYRSIYEGVKHDRSISFFLFFVNYGFHLAVMTLLAIGIPGWGGAGFIYAWQSFANGQIGAGVLCILSFTCFVVQIVFGLWQTRLAVIYYRAKGMTAEQAKEQALQGVAKSNAGQAVAKEILKSSVL